MTSAEGYLFKLVSKGSNIHYFIPVRDIDCPNSGSSSDIEDALGVVADGCLVKSVTEHPDDDFMVQVEAFLLNLQRHSALAQ